VGVEQHHGGVAVAAWPRPDDRAAPVGCLLESYVVEADAGEPVRHPGRRPRALLRRKLARVGDRPDGDDLGQLLACLRHQLGDARAQV
jgi:hypothetical protein